MMGAMSEPELLAKLAEAVVAMKPELVAELARQAIAEGVPPELAINQGLAAGMRRMGERYAAKQCFVPEVLLASRAMYAGFEILKERMGSGESGVGSRGKVVFGVVQGDIHDIGKNIVRVMTQAAGFEVVDLGRNVSLPDFVEAVGRTGADILAMSSLMTTTMPRMGKVIELLDKAGLRSKVKVMVG